MAANAPTELPIPVPRQSQEAWRRHQKNRPQNAGLVFDRFGPDWNGQPTAKKDGLERVRRAALLADSKLLAGLNRRWEAAVRFAAAEPFPLRTEWRLVAGLGRKGPLEAGFRFDRYGFPVLPGSSLKGVARAYATHEQGISDSDDDLSAIFGQADEPQSPGRAGHAIFFDSIPAANPLPQVQLDVMTPHVPKYYQGNEPPTDWQNPIPVYFLTLAPDTEMRFAVGWRGELTERAREQRQRAEAWLIGGLTELGVGAKTAAGYGYFQNPRDP